MPEAAFQTGNGITLCGKCHRDVHLGFNGRADLSLPMDAQSGEKLQHMERLYCILAQDAEERGILRDDFYHLSDTVLGRFKLFQSFDPHTPFPGPRIQQAYLIWAQTALNTRKALAATGGIPMTDQPILPGEAFVVLTDPAGQKVTRLLRNPYWHRHSE